MSDQASTLRIIMGTGEEPLRPAGAPGGWLRREVARLLPPGRKARVISFSSACDPARVAETLPELTARMRVRGHRVAMISAQGTFAFGGGASLPEQLGPDLILADTCGGAEELDPVVSTTIILVGPGGEALARAHRLITQLRSIRRDRRLAVIAIDAPGGREGWKQYRGLAAAGGQFFDGAVEYLGHIPGVQSRNFLVRSKELPEREQCLDMIAKRIGEE